MKLKKRLDDLQEKLNINNWFPDYVFKKWVFRSAIFIIVLLAVVAWGLLGFGNPAKNYFYLNCPDEHQGICENPFFELCNVNGSLYYTQNSICKDVNESFYQNKFLLAGQEFGEKPDSFGVFIINNAWLMVLLAFVVNHLLYNRGYFKKIDWGKLEDD